MSVVSVARGTGGKANAAAAAGSDDCGRAGFQLTKARPKPF